MSTTALAAAAILAFLLAHYGTPAAIAAARATGFMDTPTGDLKTHREPTPYLGGMAVFVPFLTSAAIAFELDSRFLGILLASTLAALLGLMDDFGAMRWSIKLVGQGIVVLVLIRGGVQVEIERLPAGVNLALTALWMLTLMNALNFLDIMDGLAATTSAIAAAFFLAVALLTDAGPMASLSAALLGALLGYLRFSLPKARIFLGDCGSLFLGATLGALALSLDYSAQNAWAVVTPIFVLGVPLFEIAFTCGVRVLHGKAPWRGSPDHVALRLRRLGRSVPETLAIVTLAGCGFGAAGLWLLRADARAAAWAGGAVGLAALASAAMLLRAPEPAPKA